MQRSLVGALIAVVGVALLAFLLRRFSGGDSTTVARPRPPDAILDEIAEGTDAEEAEAGDPIAVTSDGWRFVPVGDQVQLLLPEDSAAEAVSGTGTGAHPPGRWGEKLGPGDFTGARVGRGVASFGPWRLEALGPDGEYLPFPFETEAAARAALAMLERRGIVRAARDQDGNPVPTSSEQFEEARRRYERTEQELAMSGDDPIGDEVS